MKTAADKPITNLDMPERIRRVTLMRAFDFDREDLDANHNNYMSEQQRSRLRKAPWNEFLIRGVTLAIFFNLFYIVYGIWYWAVEAHFIPIIGLAGMLCGFIISRIRYSPKLGEDLRKGEITFVQGRLSWVLKYKVFSGLFKKPIPYYAPKIGKTEFPVQHNNCEGGFVEGEIYRVYYLPHSKIILSVEWIDPAELEQTR